MPNNYYAEKIVLVTGGGSGIGRELCLKLAKAGATIICTDIDPDSAALTISLIEDTTKGVAGKLDVTQLAEFENVIEEAITKYGRLDLIFNNAGIAISGEIRDITADEWKKVMDVNFFGVINGSQTAYRYMLKQGFGQIVNIASAAGLIDYLALMAPYSVSKHAVVNYTKILRTEAKKLGIKANVVCPGFIGTSIGTNAIVANARQSWNDHAIEMVAKGISVDKAAGCILQGVAKNKEIIVFPFEARIIYLVTRLFKGLFRKAMQKQVKDFRANYRVS
ncbi:MAG: short-chain dehydrogenase/reductase [Mucilaginibacter sp.]|nr:short-chain dehydrogenase/reductase [Mucilaginibacter sp.]